MMKLLMFMLLGAIVATSFAAIITIIGFLLASLAAIIGPFLTFLFALATVGALTGCAVYFVEYT